MNQPVQEFPTTARYKSVRINVLLAIAYITVIMCLLVTVMLSDIGEYAQGVVTLVLGRFLGYTDQVYSFEFGTTRDNKVKDESIANLSTPSAGTTTVVTKVTPTPPTEVSPTKGV